MTPIIEWLSETQLDSCPLLKASFQNGWLLHSLVHQHRPRRLIDSICILHDICSHVDGADYCVVIGTAASWSKAWCNSLFYLAFQPGVEQRHQGQATGGNCHNCCVSLLLAHKCFRSYLDLISRSGNFSVLAISFIFRDLFLISQTLKPSVYDLLILSDHSYCAVLVVFLGPTTTG